MRQQHILLQKGLLLSLLCSIFLTLSSFDNMRLSPALQAAEYEVVILTAPAPLTDSVAYGVKAGQSVGTGRIPGSATPDETHAVLWPAGSAVGVDLHPTDFRYSAAYETNGQKQVGSGNGPPTNFARHALLWSGSANSYIDLHPTTGTWNDSIARAIAGDQQVGNINFYYDGQDTSPRSIVHAALWRGTAASVVDLHPSSISGCGRSYGNDTDGSHQVGYCFFSNVDTTKPYRAVLWSGTATSAVILHPSGFSHSFAEGVSGNEQVGYAFNAFQGDGYSRALLWHGTAASVISLHPTSYITSTAYATNGTNQVGSGTPPDYPYATHALRWTGTATSVVDLHLLLPAEFIDGNSIAYDIDGAGNIVGLAQRPDGSTVGVLWRRNSGTPLPTSTPGSSSTNLLANAGFELDANNDSKPDTWTTNAKFTRSNTVVFSGSYAGKFFATDNSGVTLRQTVKNLTGGVPYSFSGRVNIPASSDAFTFKLQIRWRNAGNTVIGTSVIKTYTASTNGWNQATATLTAPSGTTNALVVMVVNSLNRTIYVDDFLLKPEPN
jgi:hypothetical protein